MSLILRALDRLITEFAIPTRRVASRILQLSWLVWIAARQSICSFNLSPALKPPTLLWRESFHVEEGRKRVLEHHNARNIPWVGDNVMYFETGRQRSIG